MSDSTKERVHYSMHGLEVVQPGLEPVFYPQYQNYSHIAEEDRKQAPREQRVCGFRKATFWLVAALAALSIIAVGVSVGLGVGLSRAQGTKGTGKRSSAQRSRSVTSQFADPTTTPEGGTPSYVTVMMTTTAPPASSKATSASTTSPTVISACPKGNNTVVTPTLGSVNYRILCDRDFDGAKEDLASVVMPSFDDCMNLCNSMNYFQKRTDIGCTYNVAGTGTQTPGTCWCLGGDAKIVVTNVGNQIAVPI